MYRRIRPIATTMITVATMALIVTACRSMPRSDADPDRPAPAAVDADGKAGEGGGAAPAWPASKVPSDTFVGGSTDPSTLDPAQVYQFTGAELVMSFYDGLVAFEREKPDAFVPALAKSWTVSPDGLTYTFALREDVTFHAGGSLEAHDAAYSIQRVMLGDVSGGPAWMFLRPILGVHAIKDLVLAEAGLTLAEGAEAPDMDALPEAAKVAACQAAQEAVVADDAAGTVTIRLQSPAPWFLQLVATWIGSVVDREWMVAQGDWDGSCASWTRWYDVAPEDSVLYDRENGTGPYTLGAWKKKESISLEGNPDYWRTEPAWEGGPSGPPRLRHIVLQYVYEWGAQYAKLQAGEWDAIPMAGSFNIDQLEPLVALEYPTGDDSAQPTTVHEDGILKLYRGYPVASAGGIQMLQRASTDGGNEFIGSGKLDGEGVPPDFFSDIHVRRGFNYCFDWDTYIDVVLHGDAVKSRGPIIQGMQGYRADSPVYAYDLEQCAQELALAWDGKLPEIGFRLRTWVPETAGTTPGVNEWDLLADSLAQVNPKYQLQAVTLDWPTIGDYASRGRFAIGGMGWGEDYHDASNWAQPFMHTKGVLSGASAWPPELSARVDDLVDRAAVETDPSKRDALYAQLQQIAYDEALAVYTAQGLGRYYLRREVNGWYDNPVTPYEAKGWYHLWKSEP